jgi:anti-anti-sigma factor
MRYARDLPEIPIIDLPGEINAQAEEALNAAFAGASRDKPKAILLDFHSVEYINSTGIALIVSLLAHARQQDIRVLACSLTDHYVEVFRLTRLADFLRIFPDEVSALAAISAAA